MPGQLFSWQRPDPDGPWWGYARWTVGTLQHEGLLPARWVAKRRDEHAVVIPAPAVPEGERGFVPPEPMQ